jgi:hypothetical protein
MACGKPVVTLDDAYIPNDIKRRTHITTKSNLAQTLKEKHFECNIKSNLKFAKEHSTDNMANQMIKIYKSIL